MEYILYEQKGSYAIITINREKALNALNSQVLDELNQTLDQVNLDEVRALILTGAGQKSFVAGADIGEMSTLTKAEGEAFGKKGNDVFRKLETFPIPVIAAVNGFALGGGCEISMSCDIRICSDNAVFGQPEVGLGITPGFGGTQRLARLVGAGMAKQMIYTARNIKADEAYRIGLVNAVYTQEELLPAAEKMAAYLDGNVYSEEAQKISSLISLNDDLKRFVESNDAIDEGMEEFYSLGGEMPEEISHLDFDLPDVSVGDEISEASDILSEDCDSLPVNHSQTENNMEENSPVFKALTVDDIQQEFPDTCAIKSQQIILESHDINVSEQDLVEESIDKGWYVPGQGGTMPEEYMGDVIGDLNSRRGRVEGMEDIGGGKMVKAFVPLAEMFGYSTDLRSKTQGRGNYSMFFDKYEPVPKNVQEKVLAAKSK